MDEEIERKMDIVEQRVNELREKAEAKLEKEYSSVGLIMLRDDSIGYIDNLEEIRERLEDEL